MMYLFNALYLVAAVLVKFSYKLENLAWRVSISFGSLETLADLLKRSDVPADLQDPLWVAYELKVDRIGYYLNNLTPPEWNSSYPEWVRQRAADKIEEICLRSHPDPAWFNGHDPFHPTLGRAAALTIMCERTGLGGIMRRELMREMKIFTPGERRIMFET